MSRARWNFCGMGTVFALNYDNPSLEFMNCERRRRARKPHVRGMAFVRQPVRTVASGSRVLEDPIGDGVESLGCHGFFDAAVFGGRAEGTVLEKMIQAGQFGGEKIFVAAVLQSFLDF